MTAVSSLISTPPLFSVFHCLDASNVGGRELGSKTVFTLVTRVHILTSLRKVSPVVGWFAQTWSHHDNRHVISVASVTETFTHPVGWTTRSRREQLTRSTKDAGRWRTT